MGPAAIGPVGLVGLHGGSWFGAPAGRLVAGATVLVGAARHFDSVSRESGASRHPVRLIELAEDLSGTLQSVVSMVDAGESVCLLASGDPGFFGLARLAAAIIGSDRLEIHPAPSSVSIAFARSGQNWDDALVVSVHGRLTHGAHPLDRAVDAVIRHPKVAVLVSPENSPESLGRALVERGSGRRNVTVVSRIGEPDESVWCGDPEGLAAGSFDPMSVVVFAAPTELEPGSPGWAWGRPDESYEHRDGMITKSEVRAVALGKLVIPRAGVMWDVGAGSGSVSVECARLAPGLDIYAVERDAEQVERIGANAAGSLIRVVSGAAPAVLADLPDPDRVFVGGGGIDVLDASLARLRPGGVVVATFAAVARAAEAAERLGHMVQISVSRAVPLGPDRAVRLAAENPVFVCWGPAA